MNSSCLYYRTFRRGNYYTQPVLVNLAVAMLCADIVFLAGINQAANTKLCIAIAAILHYFLLVSFAWMLVEAIVHYYRYVNVLDKHITDNFMLKTAVPSWG